MLAAGGVDSIDPGMAVEASTVNLLSSVHRGLYAPRPGRGLTPQPDLATGPPEVSRDARTLTIRVRTGVRFSAPVPREVVAADVEYGLERLLLPSIRNPIAAQVLADVEGVPEALAGRRGDVAGISAPDDRTLVLRLRRPTAHALLPALTLPLGVPVPREHAARFDARRRSTYDRHQVATGPYRIVAGAGGEIGRDGFDRSRGVRLVRNRSWNPATDARPGWLDGIDYRTGNDDPRLTSRRILSGRGLAGAGFSAPPEVVRDLPAVQRQRRFLLPPEDGLVLLTLNTRKGPFVQPGLRRAVHARFDRVPALQAFGGRFFGSIASHFIPPAVSGHRESGDRRHPPKAPHPRSRPGAGESIRVVAPRHLDTLAEAVQGELDRLGFRTRLVIVAEEALATLCGDARRAGDACLAYVVYGTSDPGSVLPLLFASGAGFNFSFLRSAAVDRAIAKAQVAPAGERGAAWAHVNRSVLSEAAALPLLWPRRVIVHSPDVVAAGLLEIDYSYTSLTR